MMGWYILAFMLGVAAGAMSLVSVAVTANNRAKPYARPRPIQNAELARKVELSKRHFGQIANRESIGEARKIANSAIKKLNDGAS